MALGDPAPDDHAVAALVPRRTFVDDVPPQALCTAALVSPHAVLTAGHCVEAYGRGTLELRFGERLSSPTASRLVDAIVLHPEHSATSSAFDLAVLWMDEPVAIAPLVLHGEPLDAGWIDRPLRAVGFGASARHGGQVAVSEIDEGTLTVRPAPDMTCRGDSGGPLLATIDGEERLVGITSAGDVECSTWGVAARVDRGLEALLLAPPTTPAQTVELESVCTAACRSDAECPRDLVCGDEGQCVVRGLEPGDLREACSTNEECGSGVCAALGDEARCLEPCAERAGDAEATGCRLASPPAHGLPREAGLLALVLVLGLRRRGARPTPT